MKHCPKKINHPCIDRAQKVEIGCKVKLRFTDENNDQATTYLIVKQVDTTNDDPQIEISSDLGKAIFGKIADPATPHYFEDKHRGVTGVYLLEVMK